MAQSVRSKAAIFKAACMGVFGAFVIGKTLMSLTTGAPPQAETMGLIGFIALLVNAGVALLLFRFRDGDANMRSVWICSRNDAIGNVAVMLAAGGVFGTGRAWPDLSVAFIMGVLALSGSWTVIRQGRRELAQPPAQEQPVTVTVPLKISVTRRP
jgi:Co/Zn/Cd efflux system component